MYRKYIFHFFPSILSYCEIINEKLKTKEYKAILEAANNDIELIQEKYELSKKQQKIENLVGWLIKAIENGYTEPVRKQKQGQFNNIEGRKYNYSPLYLIHTF